MCIKSFFLQKRNNTEELEINMSNIVYYQNDGITDQHNLVYGILFLNIVNTVILCLNKVYESLASTFAINDQLKGSK